MISTTTTTTVTTPSAGSNVAVPFPQRFDEEEHLVLYRVTSAGVRTTLTEGVHYSVAGTGDEGGGTITVFTVTAGDTIIASREVDITQQQDYVTNDRFPAAGLETQLDKQIQIDQQLNNGLGRAIKVLHGEPNPVVGARADRENKFPVWDANGDYAEFTGAQVISALPLPSGTDLTTGTAFWADDAARTNKVPDFAGQIGMQIDTGRVYTGTGVTAGDWSASDATYTVVHDRTEFDVANLVTGAAILVIGDVTVTTNLTVAADKRVAVAPSGKFSITTGKLAFNATPVGWGDSQWVFYGNSTSNGFAAGSGLTLPRARADGNVVTAGDVEGDFGEVPRKPEWFGAVREDVDFDNTDAIASAFKTGTWTQAGTVGAYYYQHNHVDVKFSAGNYYHSRTIDIMGCLFSVIGSGRGATRIRTWATTPYGTSAATFDYANSTPEVCDFPQSNWINFTTAQATDTSLCTAVGHGLSTEDLVWVQTTGTALPNGYTRATNYYVIRVSSDTFRLATSAANAAAGTAVTFSNDGTLNGGVNQVRRKSIVYGQLLFGGPVGVNTGGLAQTRDGGAYSHYFKFLYFSFPNRDGYNTASLFAPNYLQENNLIENVIFQGSNFATILLGARDRTQLDWFDCNGVRIEQCEITDPVSQGTTGTTVGSSIRIAAGRFVEIKNCTLIGRTSSAVKASTACTTAGGGATITATAHLLQNGDPVYFTALNAIPELSTYQIYYVINRTANTFELTTRIHDTRYRITALTASASGNSFTTPNGCLATIDTKANTNIISSTHMESGVVGILVDSGQAGNTSGEIQTWNATRIPANLIIENVDFNVGIQEAALRITELSELSSVHVNNLTAIYNIGLNATAPLLLDDVPRARSSHGFGSNYQRSIVHYVRSYAKVASPDGVPIGHYVATNHPDLMEPPVWQDPELFSGQPYVDTGGALKISLGANPALSSDIVNSYALETASPGPWPDSKTASTDYELTEVGTVTRQTGVDGVANSCVGLLNNTNHLKSKATFHGNFNFSTHAAPTAFAFTVWVQIPTLATGANNNTIFTKSGAGTAANPTFTSSGSGNTLTATAHALLDGNVVYITGTDIPGGLSLLTPYIVLNAGVNDFELATLDAPTTPITLTSAGTGTHTARLYSGYELIYVGSTPEVRFLFYHPQSATLAYYANPTVDPVAGVWTFYYGCYDPELNTITLRNVTGDSQVVTTLPAGVYPLVDSNVPLYLGTRKNDGNSAGNCHIDELVFYNRPLTRLEQGWIHNWGSGRAFSDHV